MAPVNGAQQQPTAGGKKKAAQMTKKKDEITQRRVGCPVLLESGCRVGEPVDPAKPVDAVKMICQNSNCEYSPFIHRRCYDEWEKLLVGVMANTSWSRSWTDAQRRSNLWDKKGYQLIGKMCRCLCDKGHVRRDLDYKPPETEDAAKKKFKKPPVNKNLPTLKNLDYKAGFLGKQLPNANGTSSVINTPCSATRSVTKKSGSADSVGLPIYQSYCVGECSFSAPSTLGVNSGQSVELGATARRNLFGDFPRSKSAPKGGITCNPSTDHFIGDETSGYVGEFESQVIPGILSLLRWKDGPVHLNDSALADILNGCSLETRNKITEAGGLGAALAKTGYFVIEWDSIRLKETGNFQESNGSGHNFNGQFFMEDIPKCEGEQEIACASIVTFSSAEERFSSSNGQSRSTNGAENHRSSSTASLSAQFPCISPNDGTVSGSRETELIDRRSLSSGFEEESVGSAKSEQELRAVGNELLQTGYFLPPRMPCRESFDSGYWQCESPWEYVQRPQPMYGSPAPGHFIPHPPFFRPYWHPMHYQRPPMYYFREYKLFDGPSIEDLFRRAMPNAYGGMRFESTKPNIEQFNQFSCSPAERASVV